jgi:hypothetical protein
MSALVILLLNRDEPVYGKGAIGHTHVTSVGETIHSKGFAKTIPMTLIKT